MNWEIASRIVTAASLGTQIIRISNVLLTGGQSNIEHKPTNPMAAKIWTIVGVTAFGFVTSVLCIDLFGDEPLSKRLLIRVVLESISFQLWIGFAAMYYRNKSWTIGLKSNNRK